MRAVMVEVPEPLLAERRRAGIDRWDEMWGGVLHMVPPPSGTHQRLGFQIGLVLAPLAERRGLTGSHETGLFRPGREDDYRVPDQVYARPEQLSDRGVDGASLVIEIRSPRDETYEKLEFYASLGVTEVLVVHPDERRVELFTLRGDRYDVVEPDADGAVRVEAVGATFATIPLPDGPRLLVRWDAGESIL